ncbi:hypothetical protein A2U01_0105854, partial [Trifolium medium]|nr:hypothetical protein [Trifolium medium]
MRSLAPKLDDGFCCCLLGELPLDLGVPPFPRAFSSSITIAIAQS